MEEEHQYPKVPSMPEVSITVMRPSGETLHARQGIQQLASKDCLVCGRAYRYSHNARRHELTSHNFDRYTNKIVPKKPKLRPNPFNIKARLMPNSGNKMQFPTTMPSKMIPHKVIPQPKAVPIPIKPLQSNLPYPLRIKALKDLQIRKKEPQILKTLLTSRPEILVSEPEILNSEPGSPETLISEPEIASFQVETILSEPDTFDHPIDDDEMDDNAMDDNGMDDSAMDDNAVMPKIKAYGTMNVGSDNEIEIARERDDDENKTAETAEDDNEGDEEHMDVSNKVSDSENNNDDNDENQKDTQNSNEKSEGEEAGENENHEVINNDNEENMDNDQEINYENDDDDDEPPLAIAPVVEINEDLNTTEENDVSYEGEMEESGVYEDTAAEKETVDPVNITPQQRDFIAKYRDIIEQINTQRCLCCNKEHPRRKAVIQHLQKNGHKVPKHTCYNCVYTFSHLGALLSHMRANVCTNLWRVIYNPDAVTVDEQVKKEVVRDPKSIFKDLLNARSYACKICHSKFQLKQFIMKHILDVHEDGQSMVPLVCVHCRSRFKDRTMWKKHVRRGECIIYVSCNLCTEKFPSVHDFSEHVMAVHAGDSAQNINQAKNIDDRPTDCPICGQSNSQYSSLVKHLKTVHGEDRPHYCQHCDAKFELTPELDQHLYQEHADKTLSTSQDIDTSIVKEEVEEYHYSCTECNAIFETVDAWTDHQVEEHNQVAHSCDQCEKKFLRPSELAEHKNTHLRVKFYPCSYCPDSYNTPQKLTEHIQQSHPSEYGGIGSEFSCDICVRDFKSRQAYSNHMRIHSKVPTHNRKPATAMKGFSPQIIGKPIKTFSLPPSLNNIPFKTNLTVPSAPYCCDICGKGFMHKKNIWKHKKVLHADIVGERNDSEETSFQQPEEEEYNYDENGIGLSTPQFNSFNFANFGNASQEPAVQYTCELCYKKFPLKNSLWKHKRAKHGIVNTLNNSSEMRTTINTNDEGRRSSCTICKITFNDKKSYYRHRKNVHKSNVQMCKICGKPLNSTLELYEHLKAAHARELLGYNANQGNSKTQDVQAPAKEEMEMDGDYDANDPAAEYQAHYPCDTCGKQFVGLLALQNHQCLNSSSQPQTFDCEICHKSYTSIAALKSHRGWHLRSPDGKAAANNSGLWMPQHKVTSKVSKHEIVDASQLARVSMPVTIPSIPSVPSVPIPTKRRLPPEVEVTVVNPNKKMRSDDSIDYDPSSSLGSTDDKYCKLCDKEFTKRAAYQRHMDEVHQPNSVFCPVCDKSFTRKSTLLVHMRKHYGDDDGAGSAGGSNASPVGDADYHTCDLCGAQYQSLKALKAHRARHHGEDLSDSEDEAPLVAPPGEFTCAQCGDGVATPRDLLAHRTMHCTPSKYFCNICKVYFSSGNNLSTHTRARHHDSEKVIYPCGMCDSQFSNKKSLQRHVETSH